jgi:phosphatidylglycerophosphatase A
MLETPLSDAPAREPVAAGDRARLFLLSGFGAGFAPVAQGTFGTAVGLLLHLALAQVLDERLFVLPLAALFFAATWRWGALAERVYGRKDPSQVVSDEVAGYFISVAFLEGSLPGFWARAIGAFVLFRIFDIAKPWPVRRFERLPGGLGIAADDAVAAILANLAFRLALVAGAVG